MVTIKSDDIRPVPEDGVYLAGEKVLMPVMQIISDVYLIPARAPGRNKLLRAAAINYAKNKEWKPNAKFSEVRPMVDILLKHQLWERIEINAALVHLALMKHEAATTVDIIGILGDKGHGLLAVWPSDLGQVPAEAPWAEMGAAVARLADRGIMIDVCSLVCVDNEKVKIDLQKADDALGLWVETLSLSKMNLRKRLSA
jgi:hypothetical protein